MSEQMDILWTLPAHIRAKAQGELTDIKLIRCLFEYVKELEHEKKMLKEWDGFLRCRGSFGKKESYHPKRCRTHLRTCDSYEKQASTENKRANP